MNEQELKKLGERLAHKHAHSKETVNVMMHGVIAVSHAGFLAGFSAGREVGEALGAMKAFQEQIDSCGGEDSPFIGYWIEKHDKAQEALRALLEETP